MEEEEEKKLCSLLTKKMEISITEASSMFPGFRFSPTDEELISYYLKKKLEGSDNCVDVIPEVDICKYEPWDLPAKSIIQADNEWFFFSPRGRKYPNGSQSKRATECGYWKATGKERNVKSGSAVIGTKRTLVFHTGRAPKGQRTEWIVHEYCMSGKSQDLMVVCRLRKNSEFHLGDTPRKKSLERRHSSALDNTAKALSGNEETGVNEGPMVAESSKESSSSLNSHSVEQIDSGIESDDKITNEFPPHASSSHQNVQESDSNEDCFADIMKDDIIKLDDPHILPVAARESEPKNKNKQPVQENTTPAPPFHGTANRRLRLRRQKVLPTAHELKNVTCTKELVTCINSQRSSKCSLFSTFSVKQLAMLIFLTLLVLFFLFVQFTKPQFKSLI